MTEKPKILVIDDEVGICEGIKRALASSNYQVDATTSSDEGLRYIRRGGYDLVLLDVMMPDRNGIDLISDIHAYDPEIVCIIITGYATVELAVNAIKKGAYDFLTKPFSVDNLILAVEQGLERRRLSIEAKQAAAAQAEARKLSEEKARLEELDRAKKQFIRLVTHELQAPIDAIQSYLNLIRDGYVSPEQLPEIVAKCLERAEEQRAMIADLLELGQLDALGAPRAVAPVRLEVILKEALDNIRPKADQRGVRVTVQVAENLPPVLADSAQCKSLWLNLLDNAVKYTPAGGSVTVRLRAEAGMVVGQVTDTGIGIPPEERARLFAEFFRARNAREAGIQGTGLGLAIVKRIVDGMGGRIAVESEVGRGSTFTFEIPAAQ